MHGPAKAIGGRASASTQGRGVATEKSSVASAFTKDTAGASNKDERTIRQAARRGKELGSDLHRIAGTSLDKGVESAALPGATPSSIVRPLLWKVSVAFCPAKLFRLPQSKPILVKFAGQ